MCHRVSVVMSQAWFYVATHFLAENVMEDAGIKSWYFPSHFKQELSRKWESRTLSVVFPCSPICIYI